MSVGLHPEPIYGISLFSGVDGLGRGVALALPGLRTVAYVEREAYPIEVLAQEMEAGTLDSAPVHADVTTFRAGEFARRVLRATGRRVEVVYGGSPCQDLSCAGKGAGIYGERSGLFFDLIRVVREVGPRYVFFENVAALVGRGLPVVLQAFAELGYRYAWGTLEAADVGAPHHRKRLFLVAVADGECVDSPGRGGPNHLEGATRTPEGDGEQRERGRSSTDRPVSGSGETPMVHSHLTRLEVGRGERCYPDSQCSTPERASGPLDNGPLALADGGHDQPQEQEGTDGLDQQRQTVGGWQFQPAGPGADGRDLGGSVAQRDDGHPVAAEDCGDPATDVEDPARGGKRGPLGEAGVGWGVRQAGEPLDGSLPAYPPGPDELDDWDAVLADHPWLAPAIVGSTPAQSDLRRVADGTATWDDVHLCTCPRAERLKALGNSVVPAQAAWSYIQLLDRLGAI